LSYFYTDSDTVKVTVGQNCSGTSKCQSYWIRKTGQRSDTGTLPCSLFPNQGIPICNSGAIPVNSKSKLTWDWLRSYLSKANRGQSNARSPFQFQRNNLNWAHSKLQIYDLTKAKKSINSNLQSIIRYPNHPRLLALDFVYSATSYLNLLQNSVIYFATCTFLSKNVKLFFLQQCSMADSCPYAALGLKSGAHITEQSLSGAYRHMLRMCHPDKNPNEKLNVSLTTPKLNSTRQ